MTSLEDRIHNCEIIHYTRRNPVGDRGLQPYVGWVSKNRPAEKEPWFAPWQVIRRCRYSNSDLLEEVERYPTFLR